MITMAYLPLCDECDEKEISTLFEGLCKDVCADDEIIRFSEDITNLYNRKGGYLHVSYGVISGTVTSLYNKYDKSNIDQILHNLANISDTLKDWIDKESNSSPKQKRYIQAYRSVIELKDFVSMESIRVDQIARQFRQAEDYANKVLDEAKQLKGDAEQLRNETQNLYDEIINMDNSANETLKKAESVSKDATNLKTEVVSILAIFAAIILAFTGGLSIFGSVISAVANTSLFRLLLITVFCIIGLFNTMYVLLWVVSRMSGKSLSTECETGRCNECKDRKSCKGFRRFLKCAPYVVGFNVFLVIMGVAIIVLHICGVLL